MPLLTDRMNSIPPIPTTAESLGAPSAPAAAPIDFPSFAPRAPWWGADLQTLRNMFRPRQSPLIAGPKTMLQFPMEDGTGDILLGLFDPSPAPAGRPLAVLIHGLTGCAESHYMLATAEALLREGLPVLRLNLRGAGPSRSQCRKQYHAGRTGDLRDVLAQLPAELTCNGIVLVGYSLGANMLLKLLGEGTPEGVIGAASISAETRAIVQSVRTCYEFDDRFVAPRSGWASADEYYAVNSAAGFLGRIEAPTLVIHALDDPWIPATAYRLFDWQSNPWLMPLLPRGGGHVGFHGAGAEPWHDQCLIRFLRSLR